MDAKSLIALASPFITTILGSILAKLSQNKPRLIAYYGYISEHKIRPPIQGSTAENIILVHTHAIVIRNNGNMPAKNIRVSHSELPDYHISENIKYEISDLPDAGKEILFPILVPKESVTISYLYFPPRTYRDIRTSVKSDEGFAKIIDVIPTINLSPLQKGLVYVLLFIGCSTVVYWIGVILIYLINIIW